LTRTASLAAATSACHDDAFLERHVSHGHQFHPFGLWQAAHGAEDWQRSGEGHSTVTVFARVQPGVLKKRWNDSSSALEAHAERLERCDGVALAIERGNVALAEGAGAGLAPKAVPRILRHGDLLRLASAPTVTEMTAAASSIWSESASGGKGHRHSVLPASCRARDRSTAPCCVPGRCRCPRDARATAPGLRTASVLVRRSASFRRRSDRRCPSRRNCQSRGRCRGSGQHRARQRGGRGAAGGGVIVSLHHGGGSFSFSSGGGSSISSPRASRCRSSCSR